MRIFVRCLGVLLIAVVAAGATSGGACDLRSPAVASLHNWMGRLYDDEDSGFRRASLGNILLPGSHNAGCTDVLPNCGAACARASYVTQTFPIHEQMCRGVRFFDVRIKKRGSHWRTLHPGWGVVPHGYLPTPWEEQLQDINGYVADPAHRNEVLLLRLKFVGSSASQQQQFVEHLLGVLGDHVVVNADDGAVETLASLELQDVASRTVAGSAAEVSRGGANVVILAYGWAESVVGVVEGGRYVVGNALWPYTPSVTGVYSNAMTMRNVLDGGHRAISNLGRKHAGQWELLAKWNSALAPSPEQSVGAEEHGGRDHSDIYGNAITMRHMPVKGWKKIAKLLRLSGDEHIPLRHDGAQSKEALLAAAQEAVAHDTFPRPPEEALTYAGSRDKKRVEVKGQLTKRTHKELMHMSDEEVLAYGLQTSVEEVRHLRGDLEHNEVTEPEHRWTEEEAENAMQRRMRKSTKHKALVTSSASQAAIHLSSGETVSLLHPTANHAAADMFSNAFTPSNLKEQGATGGDSLASARASEPGTAFCGSSFVKPFCPHSWVSLKYDCFDLPPGMEDDTEALGCNLNQYKEPGWNLQGTRLVDHTRVRTPEGDVQYVPGCEEGGDVRYHDMFPIPDYCSRAIVELLQTVYTPDEDADVVSETQRAMCRRNGIPPPTFDHSKRTPSFSSFWRDMGSSWSTACGSGSHAKWNVVLSCTPRSRACWGFNADWKALYCSHFRQCDRQPWTCCRDAFVQVLDDMRAVGVTPGQCVPPGTPDNVPRVIETEDSSKHVVQQSDVKKQNDHAADTTEPLGAAGVVEEPHQRRQSLRGWQKLSPAVDAKHHHSDDSGASKVVPLMHIRHWAPRLRRPLFMFHLTLTGGNILSNYVATFQDPRHRFWLNDLVVKAFVQPAWRVDPANRAFLGNILTTDFSGDAAVWGRQAFCAESAGGSCVQEADLGPAFNADGGGAVVSALVVHINAKLFSSPKTELVDLGLSLVGTGTDPAYDKLPCAPPWCA